MYNVKGSRYSEPYCRGEYWCINETLKGSGYQATICFVSWEEAIEFLKDHIK